MDPAPPADVIVIGAGILGASVAHHCAALGQSVLVLESARSSCAGATGGTWAWLNANSKAPAAYARLNVEGMAEWRAHGAAAAWPGSVVLVADAAASEAAAARAGGDATASEYATRAVSSAELAALEPALAPATAGAAAAAFADEGFVPDPPAAVRGLLSSERVTVRFGCDVRAVRNDGSVNLANGTELRAGRAVVVAAGIRTARLLRPLGLRLPLARAPGVLATVAFAEGQQQLLSGLVVGQHAHVLPRRGGAEVVIGGEDMQHGGHDGGDEAAAAADSDGDGGWSGADTSTALEVLEAADDSDLWAEGQRLHVEAAKLLPALAEPGCELVRVTRAFRPMTTDGLPVIGGVPRTNGKVFVCLTHSAMTLGLLLGRLLAEEIVQSTEHAQLAPYRPERFM